MTRVNSGVKFEYFIRDYLVKKGYEVVRAAGSKGAVDLVGLNEREVLLIQAKKEKQTKSYVKDETRLRAVVSPPNAKKQLWIKQGTSITIVQLDKKGNKIKMHTMKEMKEDIQ